MHTVSLGQQHLLNCLKIKDRERRGENEKKDTSPKALPPPCSVREPGRSCEQRGQEEEKAPLQGPGRRFACSTLTVTASPGGGCGNWDSVRASPHTRANSVLATLLGRPPPHLWNVEYLVRTGRRPLQRAFMCVFLLVEPLWLPQSQKRARVPPGK